jgi:hypothetical protein
MKRTMLVAAVFAAAVMAGGCGATTSGTTTVYTPGGQLASATVVEKDKVVAELHRIFDTTTLIGEGIFENSNEGLARQSALTLAQADLAQKVQTEVRGNTVVMNNQDVRSVIESNVNALIQNYDIDSAGYEPNSRKYRVRISVKGEQLVKQIELRHNK